MSDADKFMLTPQEREQIANKEGAQESLKILVYKFLPLLIEIKKSFGEINLPKFDDLFQKHTKGLSDLVNAKMDQVAQLIAAKVGAPSPQLDAINTKIDQLTTQVSAIAASSGDRAKKIEDVSAKISNLSSNVESFAPKFESLASRIEEGAKKQGDGVNNVVRIVADVSNKLEQVKFLIDRLGMLEETLSEIQRQQDEIKAIVDAIYKPPEAVTTGEFAIRGLKLPPTPPTLKLQADKDALIKHLEKFNENILQSGKTGSDINEACSAARDGVILTLLQRGPLIQFFSQLADSLKPHFRDVLPEDIKKSISEEIKKAIAFYQSAPVKDAGKPA